MEARSIYAGEPIGPDPIEELSGVRLPFDVDAGASGRLPAGSHGTVVFVHAEGEAYEVEFDQPFHALLTLAAAEIEAIPEETRARIIADSR